MTVKVIGDKLLSGWLGQIFGEDFMYSRHVKTTSRQMTNLSILKISADLVRFFF